jgi:diphosphomevalonate decarboxylase
MTSMKATAFAHTNIALIKYWGKRQHPLNLPATDSLSLTLQDFGTQTTVELFEGENDQLILNTEVQTGKPLLKVQRFLDLIRAASPHGHNARITSINHVPTAAGLASSASAFAALAMAAAKAYELPNITPKALSILARQGSGSAARSIYGGLVHMHQGTLSDGGDAFATPLPEPQLKLAMLVIPCDQGPKKVSSTAGMNHTQMTSPYYQAWVDTHDSDMVKAKTAIENNDFKLLGQVMEHSTLKMHATALTAQPGLWYWNSKTWQALEKITALRTPELPFYFTMDAGPHVKVLVQRPHMKQIKNLLAKHLQRSQDDIWTSTAGGPAHLMEPTT